MAAATAGATMTVTETTDHPGEMTMHDHYDDCGDRGGKGRSSWATGGRGSWGYGPSALNPRDRNRFVTQMMEDERYQHRKQYDPDFIGSGASASAPSGEGLLRVAKLTRVKKTLCGFIFPLIAYIALSLIDRS